VIADRGWVKVTVDYTGVTEVPGNQITREALSMMCTRYAYAADLSVGRDVLEVACAAGQGLGILARKARRVVGADFTSGLLERAQRHYDGRVPLVQLDAHWLPFRDRTFDLVILYEAIYYLADPEGFFAECRRVLRERGAVLICSVNREWSDFNPSPFSHRYFSALELHDLLMAGGFAVETFGAFPVQVKSLRDAVVSMVKRIAVSLHLIPKTMKGKKWLKRIFLGNLTPMPAEITDGMTDPATLVHLQAGAPAGSYKVIYAVGRKSAGQNSAPGYHA